jgi:hypothetical protein
MIISRQFGHELTNGSARAGKEATIKGDHAVDANTGEKLWS